ncbi:hypothetical protein R6Q57_010631 [Mikania cordata]
MDRLHISRPDLDLSGFTKKDIAPPKAQHILESALFSGIIQNLGVNFNLSPRQKAVLECLWAPHAWDFLRVVPIDGLGQHMSALEYRAILKYRLMIPLFPTDEPCPVCHKVCLDSFGEHVTDWPSRLDIGQALLVISALRCQNHVRQTDWSPRLDIGQALLVISKTM